MTTEERRKLGLTHYETKMAVIHCLLQTGGGRVSY